MSALSAIRLPGQRAISAWYRLPAALREAGHLLLVALAGWFILWTRTGRFAAAWDWLFHDYVNALPGDALALWVLLAAYLLIRTGLNLLHLLLRYGGGPIPVARLLLHEAARRRGLMVIVFLLLASIVASALTLEPNDPVRYRVQTFTSWSLLFTPMFLGAMTILLGCLSVSSELTQQQASDVFVKPLYRGWYILGKGLGLALLNLLLVAVVGVICYAVTTRYLATQTPRDGYDAMALREMVLAARRSVLPVPPENLRQLVDERVKFLLEQQPELIRQVGGVDNATREIELQLLQLWRSIGPFERADFLFTGLGEARARKSMLQLRLKADMDPLPPDRQVHMGIIINGRSAPLTLALGAPRVDRLAPDILADGDDLRITLVHQDPFSPESTHRATLSFAADGLEVLYKADDYSNNFRRAYTLVFCRLAFLGMLAVACSTFLSFPIASIAAIVIWVISANAAGLADAAEYMGLGHEGEQAQTSIFVDYVLRPVIGGLVSAFSAYSSFDENTQLVDGRLIPSHTVWRIGLYVGVGWTAIAALLGWLIFSRREIARVQV